MSDPLTAALFLSISRASPLIPMPPAPMKWYFFWETGVLVPFGGVMISQAAVFDLQRACSFDRAIFFTEKTEIPFSTDSVL
jgi:hypothetical protein